MSNDTDFEGTLAENERAEMEIGQRAKAKRVRKSRAQYRTKQTKEGNWNGYLGSVKVSEFGLSEMDAKVWLQSMTSFKKENQKDNVFEDYKAAVSEALMSSDVHTGIEASIDTLSDFSIDVNAVSDGVPTINPVNRLVRYVKRGMRWDSRQTFVLCDRHIIAEESKGNAVLSIYDAPRVACVLCEGNKKMKNGKEQSSC